MFVPLVVNETARSFTAFPMNKNGDVKNEPTRPGTLEQANEKAYAATS